MNCTDDFLRGNINIMTRIAILMSTYNGEKFLKEQLDSILTQDISEGKIDVIVRDDGSKDHTIKILNEYLNKGKIAWYAGENLMPAKSFFHLLFNCGDYDYYAFSDQDDIWDADKIESAIRILAEVDGPACYYCNSRLMDTDGHVGNIKTYKEGACGIIEKSLENELCAGGAMGCTMVMNRRLIEIMRSGFIPEKMIMHDCFIQGLCKAVNGRVLFDTKPHMNYRQHANNVVGRSQGLSGAIKYRLVFLTSMKDVTIADQAAEILSMYADFIPENNKKILKRIACYKDSFFNQCNLAFSKKLRFRTIKDSIFMRLSIILGKR